MNFFLFGFVGVQEKGVDLNRVGKIEGKAVFSLSCSF